MLSWWHTPVVHWISSLGTLRLHFQSWTISGERIFIEVFKAWLQIHFCASVYLQCFPAANKLRVRLLVCCPGYARRRHNSDWRYLSQNSLLRLSRKSKIQVWLWNTSTHSNDVSTVFSMLAFFLQLPDLLDAEYAQNSAIGPERQDEIPT